ncbi:MAG: hypothetical protein WA634_12375 [Silvibacterium sp.]
MPNASLCQFDLPSGKLCRQIALKGEYVCRHHMRLFRQSESEMIRQEAMDDLAERLSAMDLPELLRTLQRQFKRMQRNHRSVSASLSEETQLTLAITLQRIEESGELPQPNHAPGFNLPGMPSPDVPKTGSPEIDPAIFQNLYEKLMESMS